MTDAEHFACLDGISKQCSTILDAVRALKPEPSGYAEGYWEQVATHQPQLDGSREGRERERAALHRFREREPELRKVLDEVHGYLMRGAHPRLFGAVDAVRNFKIDG